MATMRNIAYSFYFNYFILSSLKKQHTIHIHVLHTPILFKNFFFYLFFLV